MGYTNTIKVNPKTLKAREKELSELKAAERLAMEAVNTLQPMRQQYAVSRALKAGSSQGP